ncbi:hypothetical protein GCM10009527_078070 [Actinomadura nitritigenes]
MSPDGRHLLILPGDITEFVDPGVTDHDLSARYALDTVVRVPKVVVYSAIYLDGPLSGQKTGALATNQLGNRHEVYLPPRPGGPVVTYEVVKLNQDGCPAELRLVKPEEGT